MKAVSLCMDYYPASGGTFTTITRFQEVFHSPVISFSAESYVPDPENVSVVHIPVAAGAPGRLYGMPRKNSLDPAVAAITESELTWLHVLYRYPAQWAMKIKREMGIPYVFVAHGALDPYVFTYRRLRKFLFMHSVGRAVLDEAACVLFASRAEKEKASRWVDPARGEILYWPVDIRPARDVSPIRAEVLTGLGFNDDRRLLLWVGRLHPMKRPLETASAFALSGAKDCVLLMMGPDEVYSRAECEEYCRIKNIKNVIWLGPVYGDLKEKIFSAADAFISYSHRENFGYTTADALSCGKPVILSPGNDLAGDIKHTRCGWFVQNDDINGVAEAISEFSTAPQSELTAAGQRGREWAAENLGFETFKERITALAQRMAARR